MPNENAPRRGKRTPPPGDTGQEAAYLRFLSDKQVPVTVKLRDGESVSGWIEYFDDCMIRLTREGRPNLFIYKQQIRTISEHGRRPNRPDGPRAQTDAPRAQTDAPRAHPDAPRANADTSRPATEATRT